MSSQTDPATERLRSAVEWHRAGSAAEAGAAYRQVLVEDPGNPDALHLLGILAAEGGDPSGAIDLLRQAVARNPETAIYHASLGQALLQARQPEAAAASFTRALALAPQHVEAQRQLGNALLAQQHVAEGIAALRRAAGLAPGDAVVQRNLVLAQYELGRRDEAIESCRTWLAGDPDQGDAAELLAGLYCDAGAPTAALELLETAIARQPAHAGLRLMLATAYLGANQIEPAIAAVHQAIALDPDRFRGGGRFSMTMGNAPRAAAGSAAPPARTTMAMVPVAGAGFDGVVDLVTNATRGIVSEVVKRNPKSERDLMTLAGGYVAAGNRSMAAEIYDILLKLDPENPMARHLLASARQEDTLPRASDGYIACLFDSYADGFDKSLSELKYQAPQLVAATLIAPREPDAASLDILDLGCGTGLCGPLLRPYARHLVGIDLSVGMLRKARDGGAYDKLVAAEITAFLAECKASFDLVVSSDVLIYFGRLEPVFTGVAKLLRGGGRFIFTLEHLANNEAGGIRLNPHGRYSHSEAHVREGLSAAGLAPVSVAGATLRMESDAPVGGLVVCARKP